MPNPSQIILDQFPDLTPHQKEQFDALGELYGDWNQQINVISRKDIEQLYTRHVLHSLALAKFRNFEPGTRILDVGTGGGFPGIPLAILFPESSFFLVDSIGKKIKVVEAISESIGLQNLKASHLRAEQVKDHYDFVVSRAVARTKMFFHWTSQCFKRNSTKDNGYLLLKGGDLDEELNELKRPYSIKEISEYFDDPFFETKKIVYIPM